MELTTGITGNKELTVTADMSAASVGSGLLDVFATPQMIALMEATASESVAPYLDNSYSSVGTLVNVSHVAATPIGMKVRCESVLTAVDGRKLTFSVRAYDECGLIGEGTHERFVIFSEKFMAKTNAKLVK